MSAENVSDISSGNSSLPPISTTTTLAPWPSTPPSVCNDTLVYTMNPLFWTFKTLHLMLACLALSFNVALAFVSVRSSPLGKSLRRVIAASALTHCLLAGYMVAKSVHAFLSLIFGFETLNATLDICKLQESPYLLAWLHCGVVFCCFGVERARMVSTGPLDKDSEDSNEPPPSNHTSCCIWLLIVLLGTILLTILFLLFAAAPIDTELTMGVCTVMIALRTMLTLCFFSTALTLYLLAITIYVIVCNMYHRQPHITAARMLATIKLGKFVLSMVGAWGVITIMNGAIMLSVLTKRVDLESTGLFYGLEVTFYLLPLLAAFLHPLICIWFITPIKDQFVEILQQDIWAKTTGLKKSKKKDLCPSLERIMPPGGSGSVPMRAKKMKSPLEGDAQSIPSVGGDSDISFRTSNASDYLDIAMDSILPDEKLAKFMSGNNFEHTNMVFLESIAENNEEHQLASHETSTSVVKHHVPDDQDDPLSVVASENEDTQLKADRLD